MTNTPKDWENSAVKASIDAELAIVFDRFSSRLPKSRERAAIGDNRFFEALRPTIIEYRAYLISKVEQEAIRREKENIRKAMIQYFKENNVCEHVAADPSQSADEILASLNHPESNEQAP